MIYPNNFEQKIGFDTIRQEIERHCTSPLGVTHVHSMHFDTHREQIETRLNETDEFLRILQSKRTFPLNHFHDLRGPLKAIRTEGSFLATERMFDLTRLLKTIDEIVAFFGTPIDDAVPYPALKRLAGQLNQFPEIIGHIDAIIDKNGNIKDDASPLLRELRHRVQALQAGLGGTLRRIITQGRTEGFLENDVQPAMRDGRLVIPVQPMHKRKLRGIVHDTSASGKTVFIEPAEIVEANNQILETEADIAREIIRILTEATDMIRPHIDELLDSLDILGRIDFARAKALFAQDVGGQMPHIDNVPHIEWYHAVHPSLLLALRGQHKDVVPLDITLTGEQRILLISGPNAGGKSVCLKTVGAVQYMMQCGILPPLYSNSHMGLFGGIGIDIGDQQSIEDDLSTYSSHLQNMKSFLTLAGKHTLLLIDEFGSGTEPQIGGAIAQAILDELNKSGTFGVITTHYQNLKHFAEDTPGIINGAMLYDRARMEPLFQLSMGYPGSSFAIEIARKIGLPQSVISHAGELVGSDYINMDRYLLDIVRDRRYWEKKRHEIRLKEKRLDTIIADYQQQAERVASERRNILHEAKDEARSILAQSNAQIEQAIREIREVQAEKEKTKEVRRQLEEFKQRLVDEQPGDTTLPRSLQPKYRVPKKKSAPTKKTTDSAPRPLAVGDHVIMKGSTTVGTIMNLDEKYAVVAFGNLKTRVETSRLERSMRQEERKREPSMGRATTEQIRARQLQFKPEIDVRGMRADEALQAVTYFIDDAIQFGSQRVRILHGTGTGVLREDIRLYLNTVAGVKSYRDEHVQFGGAGITVVDFD